MWRERGEIFIVNVSWDPVGQREPRLLHASLNIELLHMHPLWKYTLPADIMQLHCRTCMVPSDAPLQLGDSSVTTFIHTQH